MQPDESYHLHRGLVVVCDLQQGTWLEKYKSLRIEEPFIRKVPSRQNPGEIDIQRVPHHEYELRSEEELEAIRKRWEEENTSLLSSLTE